MIEYIKGNLLDAFLKEDIDIIVITAHPAE